MTKVKKIEIILITVLMLIIISLSVSLSSAYFKYKKQFSSDGDLPILNINYTINPGGESALNEIYYQPHDIDVSVDLSTEGNNINGYVRVYVLISWINGLNNTPRDNEGNLLTACKVEYDENLWEVRNGYYYLKSEFMTPDTKVNLFNKVVFSTSLPDTYVGEAVKIKVLAEIYQATNKPENW